VTDDGKRAVLEHVRWVDGHADVGAVLADPRALAEVVGPAPVVDELPDDGRARLGRVTSLVTRAELGDPDGR
jgi:hypothetical protein